ncbi:MAG TPA: hypothetical protein VHC20_08270 [Candidatus Paceibacterota bacterium]|nr:hypothetical protein [Candidatus Paceibacterota bacterium]
MAKRKKLPPEVEKVLVLQEEAASHLEHVDDDTPGRRGPKSTYDPKFAKIAKMLCERGATDDELATAFGKTTSTIKQWKIQHPDFGEAVRQGKSDVFDPKVERALAQRALGYALDVEEVKVTKNGEVVRYTTRKEFPPDVTACIFWLKNRKPEVWRDVHKYEHTGKVEVNEGLTAAELRQQILDEAAKLGLGEIVQQAVGVAPPARTNGSTKH